MHYSSALDEKMDFSKFALCKYVANMSEAFTMLAIYLLFSIYIFARSKFVREQCRSFKTQAIFMVDDRKIYEEKIKCPKHVKS